MRELQYGAEIRSLAERGWTHGGMGESYDTSFQHKSVNGNGGQSALVLGSSGMSGTAESPDFLQSLVEGRYRFALEPSSMSGSAQFRLRNGGVTVASVRINGSNQVEIYVNNVLQDTSTEVVTDGSYSVLNVHYRMLSASGLFEVFLDDDLTIAICSFSGDTDPLAATNIEAIQLESEGDKWDDVCVQSVTMLYDGGTGGAPVVGETVTDGGTGATGIITAVSGDATSGRLWLRNITGTFADNGSLTTGGTFVAVNNAPATTTANPSSTAGLESNSGIPTPFGFMRLESPNTTGAFEELTGVPAPAMGNYENVNGWGATGVANDSNLVEGATNDLRDFYNMSDNSTSFTGVEAVEVLVRAQKQGVTINNIELGLRDADGPENYGASQALAASYGLHNEIFDTNPDDSQNWDLADIGPLQAGIRVKT